MKVVYISRDPAAMETRSRSLDSTEAYLNKPFAPDVLAGKVREVLGPAPLWAAEPEDPETEENGQS
jgi:hypothetical protein